MKIIDDVLKDNDGAWDAVRIAGALGLATFLGGVITSLIHSPSDFLTNIEHIAIAFGTMITTYAAAVWGHSQAKK